MRTAGMKRYPLEPLFVAMAMTPNQACMKLGVSGSVQQKYRAEGVVDRTAELLAIRAGYHPFEIWPAMLDDRVAELRDCAECGEDFVYRNRNQRFCSGVCRRRWHGRRSQAKYQQTTHGREYTNLRRRMFYAENAEYEKARERRRYHAKKQAA